MPGITLSSVVCFSFLFLSTINFAGTTPVFQWDCNNSPEACENYCFSAFCAGHPGPYTRDIENENRRRASGVAPNSPCNQRRTPWAVDAADRFPGKAIDCDEWPPNSVLEGGDGAILRCIVNGDNRSGGAQLGGFFRRQAPIQWADDGHQFNIVVSNTNWQDPFATPLSQETELFHADRCSNSFCATVPACNGPNRHLEFTFRNGAHYENARDLDDSRGSRDLSSAYVPAENLTSIQPERYLTSRGDVVIALAGRDEAHGISEGAEVHDLGGEGPFHLVRKL